MSTRDAGPSMNPAPGQGVDPFGLIALLNEDLSDSRSLHDLSLHLLVEHEPSALYSRIVEAARQLLRSDFASLQMISGPEDGQQRLDLIAHCGFTLAAAEHWRHVYIDSTTSCGAAWARGERVIVPDAETCPDFAGTADLAVFRETGIRGMQTTPLRSREGKLIGMLSTHWASPYEPNKRQLGLLDILARQAANLIERTRDEALLRERGATLEQMDRMKDHFLATLAHELRNPLAPLRNGLHAMRLNQGAGDADRAFDMLDRQLGHLVRLVDDLMDVARINSSAIQLHHRRVDVATVLETAVEMSRPAVTNAQHTLTVRQAPDGLYLNADEVRLAQVFANLINNAAKYTPPGGQIKISAKRHQSLAIVHVEDNGIGFTAEQQPMLFTLFTRLQPQTHTDGLGVGLALAKKLVDLHGGSISAASGGPNRGSCFTVSLPIDESDGQAAAASAQDGATPRFDGQRVLLVDDNHDAADSLRELLCLLGCECVRFYGGQEALDALEQFVPTVAFVDLDMPGMNGYEFAQRIRARTDCRDLRLVALTGCSQPDDRVRSKQAGFDEHVVKPVTIEQLIAALARPVSRDGR